MKQFTRTSIALAFAALMPFSSVAAQPLRMAVNAGANAGAAAEPASYREHMSRGESLRAQGRLGESLREFRTAAKMQRRNGENASLAFWQIAEIHNSRGKRLATAAAMDEVARDAERFGDPELQVQALFEAGVILAAAGQPERALQRLNRVTPLLSSPHVGEPVRRRIESRMH